MHIKAEELRFIAPDGNIIASPEMHQHIDVIKEMNLSSKEGFEAILELILAGYAVIAVIPNKILISHTVTLTVHQENAVSSLRERYATYVVSVLREDVA